MLQQGLLQRRERILKVVGTASPADAKRILQEEIGLIEKGIKLTTDLTATKTAVAGSDAEFKIVATGSGTLEYSWRWRAASTDAWIVIDPDINPSAITATLVNHAVTTESEGDYQAIVTDQAGQAQYSKVCTLTVTTP